MNKAFVRKQLSKMAGENPAAATTLRNKTMKTAYFTFGQDHVHRVNGKTFDCDCVVKITAEDPLQVMLGTFGPKWAMKYDEMPQKKLDRYYPRGIIEL